MSFSLIFECKAQSCKTECVSSCVLKLTSSFPVLLWGQIILRNPLWSVRFAVSEPGAYRHKRWW